MYWLQECLYCKNYVYRVAKNNLKCSVCHKKTSIAKINKIIFLIECFINNITALQASRMYNISYISTKNYYHDFRIVATNILENNYKTLHNNPVEYEEYFYIEKSKRKKENAIFEAHNFLTFDYNGYIYNIVMPSLEKYKNQFIKDNVDTVYIDEFKRFKRTYKIIKISKRYNRIIKFWNFLEKNIVIYKGISVKLFPYYLKEFEFKFNYTKQQATALLIQNYFKEEI